MSKIFLRNESFQIKKTHKVSNIMDKINPHQLHHCEILENWEEEKDPQVYRKRKQVSYKILTIKMTWDFSRPNLEVNTMYNTFKVWGKQFQTRIYTQTIN